MSEDNSFEQMMVMQLNALFESSPKTAEQMYRAIQNTFLKYPKAFFKSRCGADMLAAGFFDIRNQMKEITESMSAWYHINDVMSKFYRTNQYLGWEDVFMFDIGSGAAPNTAGLFAFRTAWQCRAVDPELNVDKWSEIIHNQRIKRLGLIQSKIENFHAGFGRDNDVCVLCFVHSHADVLTSLRSFSGFKYYFIYTLECCNPLRLDGVEPYLEKRDFGVLSPKNYIRVYGFDEQKRLELIGNGAEQ